MVGVQSCLVVKRVHSERLKTTLSSSNSTFATQMNGSNPGSHIADSADADKADYPSLDSHISEDKLLYLRLKYDPELDTLGRLDVHANPSARETFNETASGYSAALVIKTAQTLVNKFRVVRSSRPWLEPEGNDESIDIQSKIGAVEEEVARTVETHNSKKEIGGMELVLTWVPEETLEERGCEYIWPCEIDWVSQKSTSQSQASLPSTNAASPK